ncbi:MAG TPA: class I SAM-dependent methyltransferase [Methylomirabilota bacterium]|nr:class I SAM-dependent methyltransferase [Methylomirabilota bacterium]
MGLLQKLGILGAPLPGRGIPAPGVRPVPGRIPPVGGGAGHAMMNSPRSAKAAESSRTSNGLKEFLWNLDGLGHGKLLDLGPAWQTTLSFFIERGFRVSSEDLLRAWKEFLQSEEQNLQMALGGSVEALDMTAEGRAARFLAGNLRYSPAWFDAILLWDVLDYLEPIVARRVVEQLTELLRPGGVVLAMFHSRRPEQFHRYRVADSMTLQMLPGTEGFQSQRIYQNREIQELFRVYRTMKSFVGRDQLREVLFIK